MPGLENDVPEKNVEAVGTNSLHSEAITNILESKVSFSNSLNGKSGSPAEAFLPAVILDDAEPEQRAVEPEQAVKLVPKVWNENTKPVENQENKPIPTDEQAPNSKPEQRKDVPGGQTSTSDEQSKNRSSEQAPSNAPEQSATKNTLENWNNKLVELGRNFLNSTTALELGNTFFSTAAVEISKAVVNNTIEDFSKALEKYSSPAVDNNNNTVDKAPETEGKENSKTAENSAIENPQSSDSTDQPSKPEATAEKVHPLLGLELPPINAKGPIDAVNRAARANDALKSLSAEERVDLARAVRDEAIESNNRQDKNDLRSSDKLIINAAVLKRMEAYKKAREAKGKAA